VGTFTGGNGGGGAGGPGIIAEPGPGLSIGFVGLEQNVFAAGARGGVSGGGSDGMPHSGNGGEAGDRYGERSGKGGSGIVIIRFIYEARPPPTIPNLAAWYTANSAEVHNGSVNLWRDVSGRGNHVYAAAITGSVKRADPNDEGADVKLGVSNSTISSVKTIRFHFGIHNGFYGDATVSAATQNGRFFADMSGYDGEYGFIIVTSTGTDATQYTWIPPAGVTKAEVFLVGGGAAATSRIGGGGGYTRTEKIESKTFVGSIRVGNGGVGNGGSGHASQFGTFVANGGNMMNGGSGGGGQSTGNGCSSHAGGAGGSNGSDGVPSTQTEGGTPGTGQGTTTREFGEANGTLYAGGGGGASCDSGKTASGGAGGGGRGGASNGQGTHHLGGGGGGVASGTGRNGGSGIVVVRFYPPTVHKTNTAFPFLYGSPTDGLRFPTDAMDATSNYTLFHVARYFKPTGAPARQRIFDGVTTNWLSGFSLGLAGVAYHSSLLTAQVDLHGNQWVLSTDQKNRYRSNGTDRTLAGYTGGTSRQLGINYGSTTGERSDWAVAEVLIYDRQLTLSEYLTIEAYLAAKYFGFATIPDGGLISGALINAVFYTGSQGGGSGNAGGRGYPLSIARLGTRIGKTLGSVFSALDYRGLGG
jgi:hypothetical protein